MPGRIDFRAKLLVIGDLRGRERRGEIDASPLATRATIPLGDDGPDGCLARFAPTVSVGSVPTIFRSMGDFHPDALFDRSDGFSRWRDMRRSLGDPSLAAEGGVSTPEARPVDGGTFADLLRKDAIPEAERSRRVAADVEALLRRVVRPHVVPASDPSLPGVLASLDEGISVQMRGALHDPAFQALESLWRAIDRLGRRVEVDDAVAIRLLDATQAEVGEDPDLDRLLGSDRGWTLVVGAFRFGSSRDDLATLEKIAAAAARARVPWLAGADLSLLGCDAVARLDQPRSWAVGDGADDRWSRLRRAPSARWIGLALPRFLLRLPYGAKTDPIERFAFEEFPGPPSHDDYLWGNPAFACAELVLGPGASIPADDRLELEDLPVHTFLESGEPRMKACAEVFLPESAAEAILARGIMPLVSYANRDVARFLRIQSVADPPSALPFAAS